MKTVLSRFKWEVLGRLEAGKLSLLDTADSLLGTRDDLVPPRRLIFTGKGDFVAIGEEFARHFRELGGLQPHHRVLEVGSGIGRMAIPLTRFLGPHGSYEGFDIVPLGVNWCTENITSRFSNFRFQLADIRNREYNPNGRVPAREFRFPYEDGSFDFVFLTSVFTHMLPAEVEHYLAEIRRVLRPRGRCLITWFVLNARSRESIDAGRSSLEFRYPLDGGCLTVRENVPEEAIAYDETQVFRLYERNGFVLPGIHYGSWSGRPDFLSFQDVVVARPAVPARA